VPALLVQDHWLHDNEGGAFALYGSSDRKLKRDHENLLGGRGRYELSGFCSKELGVDFDLNRMLNHVTLPRINLSSSPEKRQ
jgi:hypothetical protein